MTTTSWQAFSQGYIAAIYRKKEDENPFLPKKIALAKSWASGYHTGTKTVTFHATKLKSNQAWFGDRV